jgi:serine/threonine protein kinase
LAISEDPKVTKIGSEFEGISVDDQRLMQAQEIGRFLIQQGILAPQAVAPLFEEYRTYLQSGVTEPFQNLLYQRQLITLEQAQYLAQSHSSSNSMDDVPPPPSTQPSVPSPSSAYVPAVPRTQTPLKQSYSSPAAAPSSHSSDMIGVPNPSSASFESMEASKEEMVIGPYTVKEELGKGGQGVVYRAFDKLRQPVALKLMNNPWASDRSKKRFERERESMAKLDHPGIVELIAAGSSPQGEWIAMELVEGEPFSAVLRAKRLSISRRLELLAEVAMAVHAAHGQNIVHRDLKPSNVLISVDGEAKVMDFGLAKQLDRNTALTQEGAILGTPYYLAPEQIQTDTQEISPATDIYAMGVMLYEAMTGERPFSAETAQGLYHKILHEPPKAMHKIDSKIPKALTVVCNKAMHKLQEARYKTAEEFANDLGKALKGEKTLASQTSILERFKYSGGGGLMVRGILIPLVILILLLGSWFGFNLYRRAARRKSQSVKLSKLLKSGILPLSELLKSRKEPEPKLTTVLETIQTIKQFITSESGSSEALELESQINNQNVRKTIGRGLLQRADGQLKNESVVRALESVLAALKWLPESAAEFAKAQFIKAEALHKNGSTKDSLEILSSLLKSKDGNERGRAYQLRAKIKEELGEHLESAADFKSASDEFGSEGRFQLAEHARLLAFGNKRVESEKVFSSLKRSGSLSVEVLISWGRALRRHRQFDKASKKLGEAARLAPKDSRLRRERVALLLMEGRLFEALVDLNAAIENSEGDTQLKLERARLYIELGQISDAREDVDDALGDAVNDADLIQGSITMALVLLFEGDPMRAQAKLKEALDLAPRNVEALEVKACLSLNKDNEEKAINALLSASSYHRWGLSRRAFLWLRTGKEKDALKLAEKLYARDNKNLQNLLLLSLAKLKTGQKDEGEALLKKHARLRREEIQSGLSRVGKAHRLLAFPETDTKNRGTALLQYAYLKAPEDSETLWRLSYYNNLLPLQERVAAAYKATTVNPFCQRAWQEAARRRLADNDPEAAKAALAYIEKSLKLEPDRVDAGSLNRYLAKAHTILNDLSSANRALAKGEKLTGFPFYDVRELVARKKGDKKEISEEGKRKERDAKLIRDKLSVAIILTPYREDFSPPREDLIRAEKLLNEARAIRRYDPRILEAFGGLYLSDAEGYSCALFRAAAYRGSPRKLLRLVRFSSEIFRFQRTVGSEKKLVVTAKKYDFTEDQLAFQTAFYHFFETFTAKDRQAVALKSRQAARRSLFLNPRNFTAYLMLAHAHAVLGEQSKAESVWQLLEKNGVQKTVVSMRVYAAVARKETNKAIKLLRIAIQKGANRLDFRGQNTLGDFTKNEAVIRLVGP